MPPFNVAVDQFRDFLAGQGLARDLVWVFRGEVTNSRRAIWVRGPVPADNAQRARRVYERGRSLGYGVNLSAHFRIGPAMACEIRLTGFRRAGGPPMYEPFGGPLYLSAARDPAEAGEVRGAWAWAALRWWNRARGRETIAACIPSDTQPGPGGESLTELESSGSLKP